MRRLVVLLALAGCGHGVSAETCADLWNSAANAGNRAKVSAMTTATFSPGRDGGSNTGDPACGATFRAGSEWMTFVATDNASGTLAWDPGPDVTGAAHGPEGPGRDATVRRDGTVALSP